MQLRLTKRVLAVMALSAIIPAVAFAASPIKSGYYRTANGLSNLSVLPNGKHLDFATAYCLSAGSVAASNVPIKSGKFSFSGKSSVGKVHMVIHGKFVTSKKAKGTMQVGKCAKASFTMTSTQRP